MPGSRKLGRPTDHRKSMLRGMVTFLLENGKIETTVTRAKEVRAMTEKMITLGKNDTLHSRRHTEAINSGSFFHSTNGSAITRSRTLSNSFGKSNSPTILR